MIAKTPPSGALFLLLLALLSVPGCGGIDRSAHPDPDALGLQVAGWLERGAIVSLRAELAGIPLPDTAVSWSALPAGSVDFLPPGRARLLAVGSVTISAEAEGAEGSVAIEVAIPPGIVFDMLVEGNRDIYAASLDGQDLVRLTESTYEDSDPAVCGDRIVFTSYRYGNGELCGVPIHGGEVARITDTACNETSPACAPDALRIAYISDVSGVAKLWMSNADGSGAVRLTSLLGFGGSVEGSPSWSPSADRLVFMATHLGFADLFEYRVADGSFHPLVSSGDADVEPAWSPDGTAIAFASNRDGDTELYLLELSTGQAARLTARAGIDAQPAWLPDGRLVYVAWTGDSTGLRWIDPQDAAVSYEIPVGMGPVEHPAAIR